MSNLTPILLVGAGGHAKACIDVIEQAGIFTVAGLVGLPEQVGSSILGYPVLGTDNDLAALRADYVHALVTVGQIRTPDLRIYLFDSLEKINFVMPVITSPRAYVSPYTTLGAGTVVMHGAIVNIGAKIGRNCILNSQSLVEHDATIADHCHISTATVINGGAAIGTGTFIGSGTIVRESIKVGARSVIGMGQRIFGDCDDGSKIPFTKALS